MPKNASLTMMRSSAPGLSDAEAKRQSAAFWSGTATNVCRSKQGWPVYRPIRRCFSIYAGQRSCRVNELRQILPGSKFRIAVGPPVKPSIARTWPADILTIDGQIQKTFHILIPRWRLTSALEIRSSLPSRQMSATPTGHLQPTFANSPAGRPPGASRAGVPLLLRVPS
jgi:hypothetical protein